MVFSVSPALLTFLWSAGKAIRGPQRSRSLVLCEERLFLKDFSFRRPMQFICRKAGGRPGAGRRLLVLGADGYPLVETGT